MLPAELVEGTSIAGNEYGWPLDRFPEAARLSAALGYACLGGQFQFRAPIGTCEMYWLNADSAERQTGESWNSYCNRSCAEVLDRFRKVVAETNFQAEATKWPELQTAIGNGLDIESTLAFVAHFVSESEWSADSQDQAIKV